MSDPTPVPGHAHDDGFGLESSEVPSEFGISLIGDAEGRAAVLLAFGHLRWQFTPELADDLGGALVQAAQQARHHDAAHPQAAFPTSLVQPGGVTSGMRPSGLVIP